MFASHELNTFMDTMAERQLRTRKALDEILKGWEEEEGYVEETDESEKDCEIEEDAKELRRRMPF
jgi:hypothetical protein